MFVNQLLDLASLIPDPHGDLLFSALDVNQNGVIDFAGPDRVTGQTSAYIVKDNALWQESTQTVYPDFDSDRAVVTTKSRRKLTNLRDFAAVSESEDIRGNVTTATQAVAPGTGHVIATTTLPTSVQPQTQIQHYGLLVESVSATAVTNRYAYDGLNRRVSTTDGRGNTSTTTYNALGQVAWVESPLSLGEGQGEGTSVARTTYVYDQFGRQIETIDALKQSTHTVYDLRGNVIRQYGATYPVWYEYDVEGRMVAMATTRDTALDPATVDSLDHPSLDVTRWDYDPATGLLVQKLYDDGKGPSYTYTPDGKLATRTWARGVVTEYDYSSSGELASIQYSDGTLPVQKTYNRLGNPVSIISAGTTNIFEYSATTLEKISDTQLGYAIRCGYDNLGRMETLSITNLYDGSYACDVFGRFATSSFEGLDFHYAYLPGADLVNGLTYGAVKKTVAFEAQRNLVTGISYHTVDDALIAERTYTYNALGNVVARTRQRGADPVETDDFDHNLRSELIAASLGGTNAVSGDYGYAYDMIGNRSVSTNRGDVITYAANDLNQYTNIVAEAPFTPEFDDDGNQTLVKTSTGIWRVSYNAENRPVVWSNATAVVAMDYDFMGRRVSKAVLEGEAVLSRTFLYDGYLQIAAIETNAFFATTFWDPTEPIATRPLAMKADGEVLTYTHDLTKNVMEVLDSTGAPVVIYDYDAFGAVTASRPYVNRFGFSSEYYDSELGCVYYNYRHYNPLDGRWISKDVVEERGSIPLYAFVKNSWRSLDVLGLYPSGNQQCQIMATSQSTGEVLFFETEEEAMAFWSSPNNASWSLPDLYPQEPPHNEPLCCGTEKWYFVGVSDGDPCCDDSKLPHKVGSRVPYWKRAKAEDGSGGPRFSSFSDCVAVKKSELLNVWENIGLSAVVSLGCTLAQLSGPWSTAAGGAASLAIDKVVTVMAEVACGDQACIRPGGLP